MQGFYEFIQKRDQNLLKDYINYCIENDLKIDEGLFDTAKGLIKSASPLLAGALLANPSAAQSSPQRGTEPAPMTASQSAAGQRGDKFDKGGFFEKDEHVKKARQGFANINKVKVNDKEELEDAFRNPGHNVPFILKDGSGRRTGMMNNASFHVNAYRVSTPFNANEVLVTQSKHPGWEYMPALNLFVDMGQDVEDELHRKFYDNKGNYKGKAANFFGLSINRDNSITPRNPQPMPPGSK